MRRLSCAPVQIVLWALFAITAAGVSACALLDPVAEKIASGVAACCEQPLNYGELCQSTINSFLVDTGHVVHVHCAGDPTP